MFQHKSSKLLRSIRFKVTALMLSAMIAALTIFYMGIQLRIGGRTGLIEMLLTGVLAVCIVMIIVLLYVLVKKVIIPIGDLSKAMEKMAEGDIGYQFNVDAESEIGQMQKNFNVLSRKLLSTYNLIEKINRGQSFDDTFEYVFKSFKEFIPYNRIGMALIDEKGEEIRAEIARSDSSNIRLSNGYAIPVKQTSLMSVMETGQPRIINDLKAYLKQYPHSESTKLIVEEGVRSNLTLPLKVNDKCIGIIFFSSHRKNSYNHSHVNFLSRLADHLAVSFEKSILVEDLVLAAITGFANLAESRDNDTGKHIERMRDYSVVIARHLSLNPKYADIVTREYIRKIYNFSPLHDIGKVGIRDDILLKPGKLLPEEFEIMKKHTLIGAKTLKKAEKTLKNKSRSLFKTGIEIALYHHEKYNGTGYPSGLAGDDIPLSARIVSVADVFDALTSKRPYKEPFLLEQSFKVIADERNKSFDPDVVDAFLQGKDEIMEIYRSLSDQRGRAVGNE